MSRTASLVAVAAALTSFSVTASANFYPQPSQKYGDFESITPERLKAHLTFIAHDLLLGRDTPSQGLDIAAEYIAAQCKLNGVLPGGENGTYFQTTWWGRRVLKVNESAIEIEGQPLKLGTDAMPTSIATVDTTAEVVYVPGGWTNKEKGVEPFKNIDVKGKIVLTDGQAPEGINRRDLFQTWTRVETAAKEAGAVAVVTVNQNANAQTWQRNLDRMATGGRFAIMNSNEEPLPSLVLSSDAAQALFSAKLGAVTADGFKEAGVKSGAKMTLKLGVQEEKQKAYNVIGIVPGSDPTLKSEYVGVGAHYDHIGVGNGTGDVINNGADDDGSGTVALIEMSRAMAAGKRPKRSTVFIWHCGEEKGLIGSAYFASNPTIDIKKMKFMVNIDMIGMAKEPNNTNPADAKLTALGEVFVIGPKTISTTMDPILRKVNSEVHNMKLNDYYDRIDDPERIFYRSDHISYIEKGVPAIFFFSGTHRNYHRPSDEVSQINFDQLSMNAQTLFAITYEMAMIDKTPVIDKTIPGIGGNQSQTLPSEPIKLRGLFHSLFMVKGHQINTD